MRECSPGGSYGTASRRRPLRPRQLVRIVRSDSGPVVTWRRAINSFSLARSLIDGTSRVRDRGEVLQLTIRYRVGIAGAGLHASIGR